MKAHNQRCVEFNGQPVNVNLNLHREGNDGTDAVMVSWWVKDVDTYYYFSKNYEFETINEAERFLIDYSKMTAQDLVDSYTSI